MEEEMELEEGEAYSYHNNNNDQYDDCRNPDELDYIDLKLQHVLGHFQKDFEGGVSAENLGAKFGGYGSFLPTYQRSPVWSQSRSSPNIPKNDRQPSSSPSPLEVGNRSSAVPSATAQKQRHCPTSSSTIAVTPVTGTKQPTKNSAGKEKCMPPLRTVEDENSYESANKKFTNTSDQKSLKVRIKLGSTDNLSTQNKAALYSGLGLDSPSSSLEQSPFESEGRSCDPQPAAFDSPTSILQAMTSSPLDGALLLSPLTDDLICFAQKPLIEHRTAQAWRNTISDKKLKSVEKNNVSTESGNSRSKKSQVGGTWGKELDIDSSACEEPISKTLKLPIISVASTVPGEVTKVSKKTDCYREEKFQDPEAELLDHHTKKKNSSSLEHPSHTDFSMQNKKSSSLGEDGLPRPLLKEHPPSSGKKKSKGSQSNGTAAADNSKESLSVSSSKSKKRPLEDTFRTKSENGDVKLRKVSGKGKDKYSDFFGDIEQEEGYQTEVTEKEVDVRKDHVVGEKGATTFTNGSKEKSRNKTTEKASATEGHVNAYSDLGSGSGDKHMGVVQPAVAPFVIEENWVQCEKCHKWRLLPIGKNPKSLPDKWLCSMLDWLPGMNKCSFSEQETNDTVMALYQAPAPDAQNSVYINSKNDGCSEVSYSVKKQMAADRKRSLDGGSQMSLKGEPDFQQPIKSRDLASDDQSQKQRAPAHHADDGDVNISKVPKKVKNEEMQYTDEDRKSAHRSTIKKVGHVSSSKGLPSATDGKNRSSDERGHISKHDYDYDAPMEQPRDKVQVSFDSEGLEIGNSDSGKSISRKRKAKESHRLQDSLDCVQSPRHHNQSSEVLVRDKEYRKEKKARESKVEGKEFTTDEGNDRAEKRNKKKQSLRAMHDSGSSQSHRESDGTNSKRKGIKASGSHVAATSSSSKFRISDKGKASLQEMKGSPGESVSSSPMRSSKRDKILSVRSKGAGKDDSLNAAFLPLSSPRRYSDGEDGGGNYISRIHSEDEVAAKASHKSLEASDRDNLGKNDKERVVSSIDISHNRPIKAAGDGCDKAIPYSSKLQDSEQNRDDGQNGDYRVNGSHSVKSGKGSSVQFKEKKRSSKYDHDADNRKISEPPTDFQEPRDEEKRWENEHKYAVMNNSGGKTSGDGKRGSKSSFGAHDGRNEKLEVVSSQDLVLNRAPGEEKSSGRGVSGRADQVGSDSGRGKSQSLPPSGAGQDEGKKPASGSIKVKKANGMAVDPLEGGDAAKVPRQMDRAGHQNGKRQQNDKHLTSNGTTQDVDPPTSVRRESVIQSANTAIKEATNLKHMADRLKIPERTGLYFQAALKFLYGAALLESSYHASQKNSELVQSMSTYASTAKLFEFCAHDYEKSKDMASAALAYKCTEVAYLKVVFLSQSNASRDRHELQTVLKMVPPGESPSSASDVDHVNNVATADKANPPKDTSSPQVAGNQIITARNRPNFERLLNFAQNVNNAMEASKKSRAAFDAVNTRSGDTQQKEVISSIRRALDYNFQNVEGLLQLVRQATEVISR